MGACILLFFIESWGRELVKEVERAGLGCDRLELLNIQKLEEVEWADLGVQNGRKAPLARAARLRWVRLVAVSDCPGSCFD